MSASRLFYLRYAFVLQSQNDIALTGTFRYKPRPFPEKGEGLVLERIASLEKTSRLSMRQPKEYTSELPSQTSSEPMDEDMMEDVFKVAVNTIVPRSPFFLFLYLKTQTVTHIRKKAVEYLRQWNGAICVIYNLCQRQNIS